jgi:hypothetical protein
MSARQIAISLAANRKESKEPGFAMHNFLLLLRDDPALGV